ncbi:hypothetical protein PV08_11968 [Exophiala spinifera]|uniref:Fucose-specific lectin n=1 Tax=Exophiala spinifera TaxID=91928 RepID=A0A0D1ZA17_9EURO|nr:uncharacterized protein PV08_11968 [Exophiala spinifera]KIW09867.1 hypothetical protein PV08_11968 [Exophiala spinifera]
MSTVLPFQDGMQLGMGFRSLDHSLGLWEAVTVETSDRETDPNQRIEYSAKCTTNQAELASALDVSASLAISKGAFNLKGAGAFMKKSTVSSASLNFIVKVFVKNSYKGSGKAPTFNWRKLKTPEQKTDEETAYGEFYKIYGDRFIADILQGGQFVGVVSFKTRSSQETMEIKAKLEGGMDGIQVKGAGSYTSSDLAKVSVSDVNVISTGAVGVNKEAKQWDMALMLQEASKFPGNVAKSRASVAVVIQEYTSLPSFIGSKEFDYKTWVLPQNTAETQMQALLDDFSEYEKLNEVLVKAIDDVNAGQASLTPTKANGAYEATLTGLQTAADAVPKAQTIIQENSSILRKKPGATKKDGVTEYESPLTFRSRVPVITPLNARPNKPDFGSGIAMCAFTDSNSKLRAYIFWQDATHAVWSSAFVDTAWTVADKPVIVSARANTPLAACCSTDGKEVSLFYFTPQGDLSQRRYSGDEWYEGEILDQMKATTPDNKPHIWSKVEAFSGVNNKVPNSIWVFYQNSAMNLVNAWFSAGAKTWNFDTVKGCTMSPGTSLAAASFTTKNENDTETFFVSWHGGDNIIYGLDYTGGGQCWGTPYRILDRPVPLDASLSAFNAGDRHVYVIVSSVDNSLLTLSRNGANPSFSNESVVTHGIKGGDVAAVSWQSGSARVVTQVRDSRDLNEFVLSDNKWTPAGIANKS